MRVPIQYISQRVRVLRPASISQNTWSRYQINPPLLIIRHVYGARHFSRCQPNVLDAYGTELRGSCGDGKEVRCHDSRTRPSTARGKIIQSFILGKPFYWRIVLAVRSVILAGCPTCFRTSAGSSRNARLGSEAFPALSTVTAVYPPSGINETLPRVIMFVFKWIIFLSSFWALAVLSNQEVCCDCRHTIPLLFVGIRVISQSSLVRSSVDLLIDFDTSKQKMIIGNHRSCVICDLHQKNCHRNRHNRHAQPTEQHGLVVRCRNIGTELRAGT